MNKPETIATAAPPVSSSMNGIADSMDRLYKALGVAEEVCQRLTGSVPKSKLAEKIAAPAEGDVLSNHRSLADVALAQASTLKLISVRLEETVSHIADNL